MPKINHRQRTLALPLIGALVSSGLLLGSAGTASASGATTTSTTAVATSATATTTMSTTLRRKQQTRNTKIRRAVRVARNQIGDPYRYGAAGPSAFDCSGLTSFSFERAGLDLPRTSDGQAAHVRRISKSRIRRGDLMFYYGSGGVYHVGIYLGRRDGRRMILHSSQSGRPVQRDPVWTSSWFAGTLRIRG
jgi:cell wall-associated NlpC family hydrolase